VTIDDEIRVADADEIRIDKIRVAAMEAVRQNPRQIVPVCDPENQSLFRGEKIPHTLIFAALAPLAVVSIVASIESIRCFTPSI
jgi:hypothetical protein